MAPWLPGLLAGLTALPWLARAPVIAAVAVPVACPAPVTAQIAGLYRWQVARQNGRGPIDLSSQRNRFTPGLYAQLSKAYRLGPADGGFVDFDVFSGTQVATFGATVVGCVTGEQGGLEALVDVQVGLVNRARDLPVRLGYQMRPGKSGEWKFADIRYPGDPGFRLSSFLADLLASPSP
ncbi:hypothetical protein [Synechococcus sp. 1G10]|uniref:hypothetical protein n=1 Tax=Synechococcus sp. 1G10 TaxID=2025605 RepID=UPI001E4E50D7|nr:hypothetical protein [Synechococcus sp. 1G10]